MDGQKNHHMNSFPHHDVQVGVITCLFFMLSETLLAQNALYLAGEQRA